MVRTGISGTCWVLKAARGGRCGRSAAFGALLAVTPAAVFAAQSTQLADLADLSIEELGNIQVTSVSKQAEPLSQAAASIFVITNEDIRRSGATTLPEALRLAPNLEVARIDARNYAISARGFNGLFANKMLVMIDGRTVYTPLFSGVFWDAQDVMLEDVERIEVISGPGGTLWGTNAVNGVINVITRSAKDTQGALLAAGGGNLETGAAVRYGGGTDSGAHYRVYGKYSDHDDTKNGNGATLFDGWRRTQAGFRSDWGNAAEAFTLQGDAYSGDLHQPLTNAITIAGANLLGRWNKKLADDSDVRLQMYYDHTERDQPLAFRENLDTTDVEFQNAIRFRSAMPLGTPQNLVWGAGYRFAWDRVDVQNGAGFAFLPGALDLRWGNVFAQDEFVLRDDLSFTIGMRLESNIYTGTERLPSARLAWKPDASQLVWAAASRAVRAPSRIDRDFFAPPTPVVIGGVSTFGIGGGPDFASEVANVYELGYRAQPASTVSYSATAFYSQYDGLRTREITPGGAAGIFPLVSGNKATGHTDGVEAWGGWRPVRAWRLSGGLVIQTQRLRLEPDSTDTNTATTGVPALGNDPSHYWTLRSSFDVSEDQQFDLAVRNVGALPNPATPAYTAVDARFGWRVRRDLEWSVLVQNLFDREHIEFGTPGTASEAARAVFLKAVWRPGR